MCENNESLPIDREALYIKAKEFIPGIDWDVLRDSIECPLEYGEADRLIKTKDNARFVYEQVTDEASFHATLKEIDVYIESIVRSNRSALGIDTDGSVSIREVQLKNIRLQTKDGVESVITIKVPNSRSFVNFRKSALEEGRRFRAVIDSGIFERDKE